MPAVPRVYRTDSGAYCALSPIGFEGFATVYRGVRLADNTPVAIKQLDARLDRDLAIVARFERAARLGRRVAHPNIVRVLDLGRTEDQQPFVVLEWIEGRTLEQELHDIGVFPPGQAAEIACQVLAGLEAIRLGGIVHGDVKPSNLLLTSDGQVRIADLDLVREIGPPASNEGLAGTPAYMAPEQLIGDPIDTRADVYATGITLYELLAGRPPFEPSDPFTALRHHLHTPPPPLTAARSDLEPGLVAVVERALAKNPTERFQTPADMRAALLPFVEPRVPPPAAQPEPYRDENVQFTVYRPRVIRPRQWYPMLAFAHLAERPPDADPAEPDPLEEVERQARQALGDRLPDYQDLTQDSRQAVPREGELTFVPEVPGVQFNPPARTFLWLESVQREEFRLRVGPEHDGRTLRGRLSVFLGSIILAEVSLSFRVDGRAVPAAVSPPIEADHARRYRKIFASYSHRDRDVVEQFERFASVLGDRYLRDWVDLRAGEVWSDRLEQLIAEADVFQLFWSSNSMRSSFVQQEWQYALSLNRASFIRPTYWEDPLPSDAAADLPPAELARLHFQRLGWSHGNQHAPAPSMGASPARPAEPGASPPRPPFPPPAMPGPPLPPPAYAQMPMTGPLAAPPGEPRQAPAEGRSPGSSLPPGSTGRRSPLSLVVLGALLAFVILAVAFFLLSGAR